MSFDSNRRNLLKQASMGFGALAFAGMHAEKASLTNALQAADAAPSQSGDIILGQPHHTPKAKHIIFLYMDGGVSQVDSFDPKPLLEKENGKRPKFKVDATVFNNNGNLLKSLWKFNRHGESGLPISDLFPHIAKRADDLCVIRSMTAFSPNHPNANYALHSGHPLLGRPSFGSWISYGLGSANENLPHYMVIHGGQVPSGGMVTFDSGFLSAKHQPSVAQPRHPALRNIKRLEKDLAIQRTKLDALRTIDQGLLGQIEHAPEIEAAIANDEMAFRMQAAVPELMDLSKEPKHIKEMYGMEARYKNTRIYGSQCLLARRMVERGVRFIELTINPGNGDRWDQHSKLKEGHSKNALAVDQPIGALIKDLKDRGLLDETLILFTGEFGRTPFAQGKNGRDHNPQGFSLWMAGGGVKGGTTYGATDEYGYRAIHNKMSVHDLHANMLHLMGIDHKRLTYRFSGRDMRLTDVHGEIIPEILA